MTPIRSALCLLLTLLVTDFAAARTASADAANAALTEAAEALGPMTKAP